LIVEVAHVATGRHRNERAMFWTRQGASITAALLSLVALLSIWFDDPQRLTTGLGIFSAGLAFALQRVVTALAGYVVIMRGNTFTVGDRITMGGVRGDVIALTFTQTKIMEMGQPPAVQGADPAMWVRSRQFTGRIVTVTNDKVFDEPVYNYTREFPFIWEEMTFPIPYRADRARAEAILLECVAQEAAALDRESEPVRRALERRYFISVDDMTPRVFWRLTDNWLELSVRFIVGEHEIRPVKDAITRAVLHKFERASIEIASATYEIVGVPALRVQNETAA
jgi:small-conductance mechanosensitive channel